MEPFHAVVLTVSLFVLTFLIPARICLWWCKPASHQDAGRESSPAWASPRETPLFRAGAFRSGDAHYAMRSGIFSYQNCRRRLFIMVRLEQYSPPGDAANEHAPDADCRPVDNFLSPGINDRFIQSANRTVFYQYFSVTLSAETPTWARLMAWAGIVLSSVIWRIFLSQAFSLPAVRRAYGRIQRIASRVIGAIIGMFALRLLYEGMTHR